jgi:hypothetical protein
MLISKPYQNYKNKTENEWEKGEPLRASKHKAERKSYQNRRGCVQWMDVVRKKAKPERSSTVAGNAKGRRFLLLEREREGGVGWGIS